LKATNFQLSHSRRGFPPARCCWGQLVIAQNQLPTDSIAAAIGDRLRTCQTGASEVLVVGRSSSRKRLDLAKSIGLSIYEIDDKNTLEEIGDNFDVSIDSTGVGDSFSLACSATRRQGRVLEMGIASTDKVEFNLNIAMYRALSIYMSMSSEYSSWNRALQLMESGAYDPTPLTTVFSLDDWKSAFHAVEVRSALKAVITPKDFSALDEVK
jgi:threonine dehydrogenase-like Zn-dependent dehydrogenase